MAAVASEKIMDPTASPPISQSMDHNSSAGFSAAAANTYSPSYADAPDLQSTSTSSPPREFDSQSQPSKSEEYRQLFRLPPDEDSLYLDDPIFSNYIQEGMAIHPLAIKFEGLWGLLHTTTNQPDQRYNKMLKKKRQEGHLQEFLMWRPGDNLSVLISTVPLKVINCCTMHIIRHVMGVLSPVLMRLPGRI